MRGLTEEEAYWMRRCIDSSPCGERCGTVRSCNQDELELTGRLIARGLVAYVGCAESARVHARPTALGRTAYSIYQTIHREGIAA